MNDINEKIADFGVEVYEQMDYDIFNKVNGARAWLGYSVYVDEEQFVKDVEDLRKYRALEQELGIDLIKLFNAKDVYYRIKSVNTGKYSEVEKEYSFHIDTFNRIIIIYSGEYDEYGLSLPLKDFGKTWWFDKPEGKEGLNK